MNTTLGLDISTAATGYGIVDIKNSIILDKGVISTSDFKNLYDKAECVCKELQKLFNKYDIDKIIIEDNLLQFANQGSSANTIIKLAKINAIISFFLYITYPSLELIHVNSGTARKNVMGKSRNKYFKTSKRFAMYYLIKRFGKEFYKSLPRMKRKDELSNLAYDISDAIILSLYGDNEK